MIIASQAIILSGQEGYGVFSYSQSQIDNVYKLHLKSGGAPQEANFQGRVSWTSENILKLEYDEKYIFRSLFKLKVGCPKGCSNCKQMYRADGSRLGT